MKKGSDTGMYIATITGMITDDYIASIIDMDMGVKEGSIRGMDRGDYVASIIGTANDI